MSIKKRYKKTIPEVIEEILTGYGHTWISESFKLKGEKEPVLSKGLKRYGYTVADLQSCVEEGKLRFLKDEEERYYTLPQYDKWETYVAYNAIRIMSNYQKPENITDEVVQELLLEAQNKTGKKLHEQQRAAVFCAVNNGLAVVTGGPGTGKTCVLDTLVYVLRRCVPGIDIRFTAPTGKAARRITESTKNPAKTVQKELGITPENPVLKCFGGDVLIIDEISMLDMETAYRVFNAVQNGQHLSVVGEGDQLPSAGPGAVLRDLISSKVIPVVQLTKTFRQSNESNLFGNIQNIRDSEKDNVKELNEGDDFKLISTDAEGALDIIVERFLELYNQYGVENVACLLPYRKAGTVCSDNVNNILQDKVNPVGNRPYIKTCTETGREVRFTIGDPVMQLKNRAECANGDVGFVRSIKNGKMLVEYADGKVEYIQSTASQLSLAYSMSINKSQGSEYKWVVMAMTTAHMRMLNKNLLYTGVTRAKEGIELIYEEKALHEALSNNDTYERITFLSEKCRFYYKKQHFLAA